jgi:hypothetical protein
VLTRSLRASVKPLPAMITGAPHVIKQIQISQFRRALDQGPIKVPIPTQMSQLADIVLIWQVRRSWPYSAKVGETCEVNFRPRKVSQWDCGSLAHRLGPLSCRTFKIKI